MAERDLAHRIAAAVVAYLALQQLVELEEGMQHRDDLADMIRDCIAEFASRDDVVAKFENLLRGMKEKPNA